MDMQNEHALQNEHTVYVLRQMLDDEIYLFQPIRYSNYSRLTFSESVPDSFLSLIAEAGHETPNEYFHLRTLPKSVEVASVSLDLEAPDSMRENRVWIEPLKLEFQYAVWQRHDDTTIAVVPNLNLKIVRRGAFDANFVGQVKKEIRNSLVREGCMSDLKKLVWANSRREELVLTQSSVPLEIRTPKQIERETEDTKDKESTLRKVALPMESSRLLRMRKLKKKKLPPLPMRPKMVEYDEELKRLAKLVSPRHRKSVLLVGPAGCGKTSLVRELANQKSKLDLAELECWATDGSRLVAGMSGYGQWQERCTKLVGELKQKSALLHLGNLVELLEVGKSTSQNEGIASFLRTFIQRGSLLATAECTIEQLAIIEQRDPQLLQAFERLVIKAPDQPKSIRILRSVSDQFSAINTVNVPEESLDTLYRLHRRFATYSDHPGRPIRFLRNLIQDAPRKSSIQPEQVVRAFSNETGLPFFLLSESEPLILDETKSWFSERVMGQFEPVNLVSDLLATVKTNLTPTGRPIASFLFIGPTGVGKTQMAKSLAEFMYQNDRRLIRFDMSEFRDRVSVERMIGGFGQPQGLLTSKVRQHPFSVVLFDEFEKADRSFFDLLLQVLGEGRLTDGRGKTTDFSTAIIVMTSNLGVGSFRTTSTGFAGGQSNEDQSAEKNLSSSSNSQFKEHFTSEVKKFVRPELFNRIDRVVPFMPLSKSTVKSVVRREIDQLKKREGIWFRGVNLNVDDAAVELIATQANDPRYGARPIQRHLQQHLAVNLADRLNRYSRTESKVASLEANVSADGDRLTYDVKASDQNSPSEGSNNTAVLNNTRITLKMRVQRKKTQQLFHSNAAQRIRNKYFREQQLLERKIKKLKKNQATDPKTKITNEGIAFVEAEGVRELQSKLDRINELNELQKIVFAAEDELLTSIFQKQSVDSAMVEKQIESLNRKIDETIYRLFLAESKGSDRVILFVFSRHDELSKHLIDAYIEFATQKEFTVNGFLIQRYKKEDRKAFCSLPRIKTDTEDTAPKIADVFRIGLNDLFRDVPSDRLGFALDIRGPAAFSMLSAERGAHIFKNANRHTVAVQAIGGDLNRHELPAEISQMTYDEFNVRRTYDIASNMIRDEMTERFEIDQNGIVAATVTAIQESFDKILADFIKS
ncbi:MAG: AAA family ATPase [Mariniblastus sp.]